MIKLYFLLFGLLSCNGIDHKQNPNLQESIKRGAVVYEGFCMSCHLVDGKGVPGAYPPLDQSDFLLNKQKESIHAIKYGLNGEIIVNDKTYNNAMSSLGLSNQEIADVMNYINNSWNNQNDKLITPEEVSKIEP